MRLILLMALFSAPLHAARLKDIAQMKGARDNQLVGYGLIVGLQGSGDKSVDLTAYSMEMMLKGMGLDPKNEKLQTKNIAAVVVTANLPPFVKMGSKLDVSVASIGTASSLEGGTLMMTSLRGPDGNIYAMAQGKVILQKKSGAGGASGGGSSQNTVTGIVPNGALLEKELNYDYTNTKAVKYLLTVPDFTTSVRISKRINEELGGKYASATDPATVDVIIPYQFEGSPMELVAQIESIEIEADRRSKVVINPRTGTVIMGEHVRISPVAIAHANLKVEVTKNEAPADQGRAVSSAPAPATGGGEEGGGKPKKLMLMDQGTNIAEIVSGLNDMGASAEDMIILFNSLKASGALMAEVEMQ